jgi:chorismate mutase
MAKKQKRKTTVRPAREQAVVEKSETPASSRASAAEFNPDYSNVKKDLKRIGLLAGSFFVVLIILSFILR